MMCPICRGAMSRYLSHKGGYIYFCSKCNKWFDINEVSNDGDD